MLIRIDRDRAINPAHVMRLEWHRRGRSASALVITMDDGVKLSVWHHPEFLDGVDAYAVEAAILAAMEVRE